MLWRIVGFVCPGPCDSDSQCLSCTSFGQAEIVLPIAARVIFFQSWVQELARLHSIEDLLAMCSPTEGFFKTTVSAELASGLEPTLVLPGRG